MNKTFYIKTMGCQMNEYDSDLMARSLITNGYKKVNEPADADIILINTCAVRAKPEQKAASFLGRMNAIKNKKPETILGIVGCMAQKQGKEFFKRFPLLDLIMGPRDLDQLIPSINNLAAEGKKVVCTNLDSSPPESIGCPGYFKGKITGFISIMEGCNNFCSYCIVPYVRGREISKAPDDIIKEVEELVSDGVKEITLLGQNVISYQWKKVNVANLLKMVTRVEGVLRLRFTTSHPKDLSDEIIRCFREIDNLCPHIHLPFQSGSNEILDRMKRKYTREQYLNLVDKLRDTRPDIAITSDVMVGFPGETEEDFQLTLDLIRRVRFDGLFSFKYSDRSFTLSEKMPNKIAEPVKSKRLEILQALQKQITIEKNYQLKGFPVQVLIEGKSKQKNQVTGKTATNKTVNISNDNINIGDIVEVTVKDVFVNSLKA